jgi:hypothetical protein
VNFADYLSIVSTVADRTPDWRKGQTYFNVLREARPDLAEKVRGSVLDPFQRDERIEAFLAYVYLNWDGAA